MDVDAAEQAQAHVHVNDDDDTATTTQETTQETVVAVPTTEQQLALDAAPSTLCCDVGHVEGVTSHDRVILPSAIASSAGTPHENTCESDIHHRHIVRVGWQKCAFIDCPNANATFDPNKGFLPCPNCFGQTLYCSDVCMLEDTSNHYLPCCAYRTSVDAYQLGNARIRQLSLQRQPGKNNKTYGLSTFIVSLMQRDDLRQALTTSIFFVPLPCNPSVLIDANSSFVHICRISPKLTEMADTSFVTRQALLWIRKKMADYALTADDLKHVREDVAMYRQNLMEQARKAVKNPNTLTPAQLDFAVMDRYHALLKSRGEKPYNKSDRIYVVCYPPCLSFAFVCCVKPSSNAEATFDDTAVFRCKCLRHTPPTPV